MKRTGGTSLSTKKQVLIVEDDFYIRSLYAMELESSGFRVFEADNAAQGRNVLASEKINLIVLDYMLPGERGIDILDWLKKNDSYRNIPVIMLTNVSEEELVNECIEKGAVAYLQKTHITPKDFSDKIQEISKTLPKLV